MTKFFKDFETINYRLPIEGLDRSVTNILGRFKFLESILRNIKIFYPYRVEDGETAEMVSEKFYGSVDHHWVIHLFNQIRDPYFDWVMTDDVFEKFIEMKYGSAQYAKQTVKFYYQDISRKRVLSDGTIVPEIKNIITQEIYNTLDDPERSLVYIYDYESDLNEKRRNIQIIDAVYIPQILKEKERIFR
jgi:hypothetical protein